MAKNFRIISKNKEVKVICSGNSKVNIREFESLKKRELDNLLPPAIVDSGKGIQFFYDVTGYDTLYNYAAEGIKRNQYAAICKDFIKLLGNINGRYMQLRNLLADVNYVFINPSTHKIKYIYVPVIHCDNTDDTLKYMRTLPYNMVFDSGESHEYVQKYIDFFKRSVQFSLYEYSLLIDKIADGKEGLNHEKEKPAADMTIAIAKAYLLRMDTRQKEIITKSPFIIGKNSECDFCLDSSYISRKHAQILCKGNRFYLTDLNSTNHTYLAGDRLEPYAETILYSGCEVSFADVKCKFIIEDGQ